MAHINCHILSLLHWDITGSWELAKCPSGRIAMENHNFQWVNPLFLWPCSIAM